MYVNPKQKKRVLLTTLIIALAIPLTVVAAYFVTQIISNASQEAVPNDVVVSNLTATSLTVSWLTPVAADGSLTYQVAPAAGQVAKTVNDLKKTDTRGVSTRKTHYVELSGLEPATSYIFTIYSNSRQYLQEKGKSFTFKTAALSESVPVPNPVYGNVKGISNDDAIVFVMAKSADSSTQSLPVSSVIRTGGNWIVDLSGLKDSVAGTAFAVSADSNISIMAQSESSAGVVYNARYSDVFDATGHMKDAVSITVAPATSIIASLPTAAVINKVVAAVDPCAGKTCGCGTLPACPPVDPCAGKTCGCGTLPACPPVDPCAGKTCGCGTLPTCPPVDPCAGKTCGCGTLPVCPVDPCTGLTCGCGTLPACQTQFVREFKISQDVSWGAIVLGSTTTTLPDIPFGKDSIKVTNITDTGFTVVWISSAKEQGWIKLGTAKTDLATEYLDTRDTALSKGTYNVHSIDVTKLTPSTQYYYKIYAGSAVYNVAGEPYGLKTFDTLASPPPYKTVSGKVSGLTSPDDAVVLIQLSDKDSAGTAGASTFITTMPDATGNWIASIGDARNAAGTEYFTISNADQITASAMALAEPIVLTQTTNNIEDASLVVSVKVATPTTLPGKVAPLSSYGVFKKLTDLKK